MGSPRLPDDISAAIYDMERPDFLKEFDLEVLQNLHAHLLGITKSVETAMGAGDFGPEAVHHHIRLAAIPECNYRITGHALQAIKHLWGFHDGFMSLNTSKAIIDRIIAGETVTITLLTPMTTRELRASKSLSELREHVRVIMPGTNLL